MLIVSPHTAPITTAPAMTLIQRPLRPGGIRQAPQTSRAKSQSLGRTQWHSRPASDQAKQDCNTSKEGRGFGDRDDFEDGAAVDVDDVDVASVVGAEGGDAADEGGGPGVEHGGEVGDGGDG